MANRYCSSCLSRTVISAPFLRQSKTFLPPTSVSVHIQNQIRAASKGPSEAQLKYKRKAAQKTALAKKKKKSRTHYIVPDMKKIAQYSLVDAMRYLRAAEVGRSPSSSKYELHVRFRTAKNGAVIRSATRLPHPVKTDNKICVIAPRDSEAGKAAIAYGAVLVGEDEVFEAIKRGPIAFDRCLCHTDSAPKLLKANVARILGPKGLMPSAKLGTITNDIKGVLGKTVGSSQYRERMGVVRLAIGQLGFTPAMLSENIKAIIERLRMDAAGVADRTPKELDEVVLSSTNGPGLTLNGELRGENSIPTEDLIAT